MYRTVPRKETGATVVLDNKMDSRMKLYLTSREPSEISSNKHKATTTLATGVGFSSLAPVQEPPSPRSLQKAMLLIVEGGIGKKRLA
jgi:hypothetical protein